MTHVEHEPRPQILVTKGGGGIVLQAPRPASFVMGRAPTLSMLASRGGNNAVIQARAAAQQIIVSLGGAAGNSTPMIGYALETTLVALKLAVDHLDTQVGSQVDADTANTLIGRVKQLVTLIGSLTTRDFATDTVLTAVRDRMPAALHLDRMKVSDRYTGSEYLEDQDGAGAVLDFNFAAAPDLTWVLSAGDKSRAAYGIAPTASRGAPCDDGVPTPISLSGATALKVYAPIGAKVSVWGFRYT